MLDDDEPGSFAEDVVVEKVGEGRYRAVSRPQLGSPAPAPGRDRGGLRVCGHPPPRCDDPSPELRTLHRRLRRTGRRRGARDRGRCPPPRPSATQVLADHPQRRRVDRDDHARRLRLAATRTLFRRPRRPRGPAAVRVPLLPRPASARSRAVRPDSLLDQRRSPRRRSGTSSGRTTSPPARTSPPGSASTTPASEDGIPRPARGAHSRRPDAELRRRTDRSRPSDQWFAPSADLTFHLFEPCPHRMAARPRPCPLGRRRLGVGGDDALGRERHPRRVRHPDDALHLPVGSIPRNGPRRSQIR